MYDYFTVGLRQGNIRIERTATFGLVRASSRRFAGASAISSAGVVPGPPGPGSRVHPLSVVLKQGKDCLPCAPHSRIVRILVQHSQPWCAIPPNSEYSRCNKANEITGLWTIRQLMMPDPRQSKRGNQLSNRSLLLGLANCFKYSMIFLWN